MSDKQELQEAKAALKAIANALKVVGYTAVNLDDVSDIASGAVVHIYGMQEWRKTAQEAVDTMEMLAKKIGGI